MGSSCDQPLPFNRIHDMRVIATHARGALLDVQLPSPRNDFTGRLHADRVLVAAYDVDTRGRAY